LIVSNYPKRTIFFRFSQSPRVLVYEVNFMKILSYINKLNRIRRRLNGATLEYNPSAYAELVKAIQNRHEHLAAQSDSHLQKMSMVLTQEAQNGIPLDNLLVPAFALVYEAARRILSLSPFDSQLFGAIVLHQGKVAQMPTGEGKTLAAVFPAFLNGLAGKGVHILTFNDYLARRDAHWMGPIYRFLGLKAAFIEEGMSSRERRKAYQADITYLTANEAGFDFLRDTLVRCKEDQVQRGWHFALVDEADAILIDAARTPLVIASAIEDASGGARQLARIARTLKRDRDVELDEYGRNFSLSEHGARRVEALLNCGSLYAPRNMDLLTRLNCAIHAEFLFARDVDYIVRNHKIELVDEFTGRVAESRRWPDGLQAALEAKENLPQQSKGRILNTITLRHFMARYDTISGMTATAQAAEEEFKQFYNLDIVIIPPHKPCIRQDLPDRIFHTKTAKQKALLEEIVKLHNTGRPILVGTSSVAESEILAAELRRSGVHCQVLNAKNDALEAGIVARAGQLGAVTISTNMAGRGTDIRLGVSDEKEKDRVAGLGGLYVLGTNRYESRRIDDQLRGRAGRQGDPGSSCFYISLEDDLFVKYHLADLLPPKRVAVDRRGEINSRVVKREIERVQRIIDGQNLEIKKTLNKYSWLPEIQRQIIASQREAVISEESNQTFFQSRCPDHFNRLSAGPHADQLPTLCRTILLHCLDDAWSRYLDCLAEIREGIHLTRLGLTDPLHAFQKLAIEMFEQLQEEMEVQMVEAFERIDPDCDDIIGRHPDLQGPASTWTYLVNDDPFEQMIGLDLAINISRAISIGLLWLTLMLVHWFEKFKDRRQKRRHGGRQP
jgi:preprotein translocase subunit SecA